MDHEDYLEKIASFQEKDVVIITDRGCMDNLAYAGNEGRKIIFNETGWTKDLLRDKRYDLVIHLVTAAKGAEEFYTQSNNEARRETIEEARFLDGLTELVWSGHHNHE